MKNEDFIFTVHGNVIPKSTITRIFTYYIKELGVNKIRLHDLRHCHVALLINFKEDILNIHKRLGHTDASITLNVFEHLYNDKDRELTEKLERSCTHFYHTYLFTNQLICYNGTVKIRTYILWIIVEGIRMRFKSVSIKNFRNFENINIELSNRNVFFGMNDVGKTNFLYALRFVLDKEVRKNNLLESDYHDKKVDSPIEIIIELDISDTQCVDSQKIRAKLKGAILSNQNSVYIKLDASYDENEMLGIPMLFWGGDISNLSEMKQRGYLYEIDYVINVIYIDSHIELDKLFKKNVKTLVKNDSDTDVKTIDEITQTVKSLNDKISTLSGIKEFESQIKPSYNKIRDDNIEISVKSEIAVKGLYSNIVPYIKKDDCDNLYPTSGDGRRKLLVYSIYDLISKESEEKKINVFLVEEPENHLHKSIQISLSRMLFNDDGYKYLFITTHSPYILYEMNNVSLVRIYNETKINSASEFYSMPEEFKNLKRKMNKQLSEAIFADIVLLVEGPSELHLFDKVLTTINPHYESNGTFILAVNGIGFEKYLDILDALNIYNIIKTDNDLRIHNQTGKFSVLGFIRINKYVNCEDKLAIERVDGNTIEDKISLYDKNKTSLDNIRKKYGIYLSKSDLENDLYECLGNKLEYYLNSKNVVELLQNSKHYNMLKLIDELTDEDCIKIYSHYNFACLKEVL